MQEHNIASELLAEFGVGRASCHQSPDAEACDPKFLRYVAIECFARNPVRRTNR